MVIGPYSAALRLFEALVPFEADERTFICFVNYNRAVVKCQYTDTFESSPNKKSIRRLISHRMLLNFQITRIVLIFCSVTGRSMISVLTEAIRSTTSIPEITCPNAAYEPSRYLASA